jgi:futalosine hydrolase
MYSISRAKFFANVTPIDRNVNPMLEICRMRILVVSATEMEIAPFSANKLGVDILVTGVGSPACMYAVTKALNQKPYDLAIQAGIAGVFNNEFQLGETVFVEKDLFADLGILETNVLSSLAESRLANANSFPYQDGWLLSSQDLVQDTGLQRAVAITVNTVGDNMEVADRYIKKYNPQVESMEGAAFHYACLKEKVPFIQLRGISNRVGERRKSEWKIKEAVGNLNSHLLRLVTILFHSAKTLP